MRAYIFVNSGSGSGRERDTHTRGGIGRSTRRHFPAPEIDRSIDRCCRRSCATPPGPTPPCRRRRRRSALSRPPRTSSSTPSTATKAAAMHCSSPRYILHIPAPPPYTCGLAVHILHSLRAAAKPKLLLLRRLIARPVSEWHAHAHVHAQARLQCASGQHLASCCLCCLMSTATTSLLA